MERTLEHSLQLARCIRDECSVPDPRLTAHVPAASTDSKSMFDGLVTNDGLKNRTRELFHDGHYARAVEEAYKYLDNLVKRRVAGRCESKSGVGLMREAFSPNKLILRINAGLSDVDKDEQRGYMDILSGCMMGIRNPRVHDGSVEDDEISALQLIAFADHLASRIERATDCVSGLRSTVE